MQIEGIVTAMMNIPKSAQIYLVQALMHFKCAQISILTMNDKF